MPYYPIILPPTNTFQSAPDHLTKLDSDDQLPDIPDSESDEDVQFPDIPMSKSDNLYINIPNTISNISFLVSDDHGSDVMDLVSSNKHDILMSDVNTKSGSNLVFPESPVATGASRVILRDPDTGRFTAASFANFPDELLD